MSKPYQSLSHSKWDCEYRVVFDPKRRRKVIFGQTRRPLGPIFHALARQKDCQIIEGHLMPDHVHLCIAIPPKHPVASVIGFLKWKSAIAIARRCGKERISLVNISGPAVTMSPREYLISTMPLPVLVGMMRDEAPAEVRAAAKGLRSVLVLCACGHPGCEHS